MPRVPAFAFRMAASSAPRPPAMSATTAYLPKSYAPTTARSATRVCAVIDASKSPLSSRCSRRYSQTSTPCVNRKAFSPVRHLGADKCCPWLERVRNVAAQQLSHHTQREAPVVQLLENVDRGQRPKDAVQRVLVRARCCGKVSGRSRAAGK